MGVTPLVFQLSGDRSYLFILPNPCIDITPSLFSTSFKLSHFMIRPSVSRIVKLACACLLTLSAPAHILAQSSHVGMRISLHIQSLCSRPTLFLRNGALWNPYRALSGGITSSLCQTSVVQWILSSPGHRRGGEWRSVDAVCGVSSSLFPKGCSLGI